MITIYEVKTGNPILTFHPRGPAEFNAYYSSASAMCKRINDDFGCSAVVMRYYSIV